MTVVSSPESCPSPNFGLVTVDQDRKYLADRRFSAYGFSESQMGLDLVTVATAFLVLEQVTLSDQVVDDAEGTALGDAHHGGDVAQPRAGVMCDADEDPGVAGQKAPLCHHP